MSRHLGFEFSLVCTDEHFRFQYGNADWKPLPVCIFVWSKLYLFWYIYDMTHTFTSDDAFILLIASQTTHPLVWVFLMRVSNVVNLKVIRKPCVWMLFTISHKNHTKRSSKWVCYSAYLSVFRDSNEFSIKHVTKHNTTDRSLRIKGRSRD